MRTRENNIRDAAVSRTAVLVTANIVAVGVYLIAASFGWVEREVEDISGASGGGAVVWFLHAGPVLLLSFFANFGYAVRSLIHWLRSGKQYFFWGAWLVVPAPWVLAVVYDFSRHGI